MVHTPAWGTTAEFIAIYLSAHGQTPNSVKNARSRLKNALPSNDSVSIDLVDKLLGSPGELLPDQSLLPFSRQKRNRALDIAHSIGLDLDSRSNTVAGTVNQLMDRYAAGRSVIVQALRILEDQELLNAVRGRSGGTRARSPSAGAIVKVVSCHLAAHQADWLSCGTIVWAILENLARQVASADTHRDELVGMRKALSAEAILRQGLVVQATLFARVARLSDDVVQLTLLQCLWSYQLQRLKRPSAITPEGARMLASGLRFLIDSMLERDARSTVRAVQECRAANVFIGRAARRES